MRMDTMTELEQEIANGLAAKGFPGWYVVVYMPRNIAARQPLWETLVEAINPADEDDWLVWSKHSAVSREQCVPAAQEAVAGLIEQVTQEQPA